LKKDHLGPELPSISCTTLCWLEDFLVRVRKIYRGRMGSGVRAVRESVLNRRLARRPIGKSQILKARVGVQAMLSGRFGLNGIGKLCPVACHVN
jgi:ribosomal protein L15E